MEPVRISLTEAEWHVMECLWEHAPRTGREATEWLEQQMGWSRSTTLTLLRRLEDKGAVESRAEHGIKVFLPRIAREDAAVQETEDFLDRVYRGSLSMMVSALTRKQSIPRKELDELYALLQELEEDPHD